MKRSGRPRPVSTAVILSLLTILPYLLSSTGAAYGASPSINYTSQQMNVNGTQDLTVSGGCGGPYTWSVVRGGGRLSGPYGTSGTYSAPGANSGCKSNPIVRVMADSCNEYADLSIAVNGSTSPLAAYYVSVPPFCIQPVGGYCYLQTSSYRCDGSFNSGPRNCVECAQGFYPCMGADMLIWMCDSSSTRCGNHGGIRIQCSGVTDLRSQTMKDEGCCPADLPENDQTHSTGGDCSINKKGRSATNLRSGNLYHDQDVGTLTLSYNSMDTNVGPLGKGWTHRYNEKLTALSDNATLILRTDDGNIFYFHLYDGVFYPEPISGDTSRIVKNLNNTYTRTLKNGTAYGFDASGRLISITDHNSNTTTLTYSGSDLAGITDPNSRTTTFGSSGGKIISMTDPAGRTYSLAYTSGLLTSITDPLNNVWHYTYDTAGRMLTKIDPAGRTVTYTYDTSGRLLTSTDPESKTRTMGYTQSGTTAFTEEDGGIWTYQYDPTFSVKTRQTDPLGNITRYVYDLKRNLVSETDPSGGITRYTYDGNSNLTSMTDPLNHTTSYTYNALNLIASRTDPKGGVTTYIYDANGNLSSTTDPAGITTFQYDTKGNITAITDADNRTTVMTYDAQNNLISIVDPQNDTTTFTYDAVGNRLTMTDPLGHVTSYAYNALNQMTQVADPLGHITHFTYDYQGNVLTTTDANNKPTGYEYNYRGQVTRITDALNHITRMSYGPTGCGSGCGGAEKLTSLTDAQNHITGYSYDLAGRMVKETNPKGQEINSTYDARGNLLTRIKPEGRTITYTYDAANRLTQKQYPGGGLVQYQYDANGNMTYAVNSTIAYNFTYDANNRLTQVTDSNAKTIQYQYSAAGKRTAVVTPENKTIAYTYDSAGRPATVASEGRTFTFSYDAASRRTGLAFPNSTSATYTYDNNGNLIWVRYTGANQAVLTEVGYTYDAVNNRLNRTDSATSGTETAGTETMTYSAANELLGLNTATYGYDPNGNRILKIEMDGLTAYSYDDENRLIRVETTGGTVPQVITYAYDPFGSRIEKNVNGTITRYLYDREDILLEYNQAGAVVARYLHGPGIDEPLAVEKNSQMYYYHADSLGSIIALTDSTGGIAQTYKYDAFGNIMNGTPTITQPYTYTAREYDPEIGLYYYRARYYDPKAGRFITKDPISFNGGDYNLFAYVRNNPVNLTDPEGLEVSLCKRQAFTTKFGKRYAVPHCYIVVNGNVYSWHTKGEGITANETPSKNDCKKIECCKNQDKFDSCVLNRIKMDVGNEGDYWWPIPGGAHRYDCCTWANSIINLCYQAAGCGN